jgi:hypothetical protein
MKAVFLSSFLLLATLFCRAEITLTLQSSSCTQGTGRATLNGSWKNGACVKNENISFPNATCIAASQPAAVTVAFINSNRCCSERISLTETRRMDDSCTFATTTPYIISDKRCQQASLTGDMDDNADTVDVDSIPELKAAFAEHSIPIEDKK